MNKAKVFGRRSNMLLTQAAFLIFLLYPFLVYILYSVLFQRLIHLYLFFSILLLLCSSLCSVKRQWNVLRQRGVGKLKSDAFRMKTICKNLKLWLLHRKRVKNSQISNERDVGLFSSVKPIWFIWSKQIFSPKSQKKIYSNPEYVFLIVSKLK